MSEECEWRQFTCPYCKQEGCYKFISGHRFKKKSVPIFLCLVVMMVAQSEKIKRHLMADLVLWRSCLVAMFPFVVK